MSTVAVRLAGAGIHPPARRIRVAFVGLISAAGYAVVRLPGAEAIRAAYLRTCAERGLRSNEWLCDTTTARATIAFLVASLLIGVAVALPCALLASTGRRATAFVPLLAGLAAPLLAAGLGINHDIPTRLFGITDAWGFFGNPADNYWQVHDGQAVAVDAVLLALPAMAIVRWRRPFAADRPLPSRLGARLASFLVIAGVVGVEWASNHVQATDLGRIATWGPPIVMATFAALLGTDRRWWPWVLAPVAALLSLGPAMAVLGTLTEYTILTSFRAMLPLAAVGLVASCWRPLALRFSGLRQERGALETSTTRAFRPAVALNALAAGVLVVSFLAARFDPAPVQVSEILPTYLGARELAQDVRAKSNLHEAILAMEGYRAQTGSYRGFGPATGEGAIPSLAWAAGASTDELVVGVTVASNGRAQVVTESESGAAFCLESVGGVLTFGEGTTIPDARRGCAGTSWSTHELAMVDFGALCDGAPGYSVLLCRSVEQLIEEILATPTSP